MKKIDLNMGYCGLALGLTGAFNILKYLGRMGQVLEGVLLGTALLLLVGFALEAFKNKVDILEEGEKNLSLLPTAFMALANITTHLEVREVWLLLVGTHLLYGLFFYRKILFRGAPLVSYYIPLVGIAVNIPAAHLFQMDLLGRFLLIYGGVGYLVVTWRLLLYWRSFRELNFSPILAILCAPLALWIQGGMIYLEASAPIKGALLISVLTTLGVYLLLPLILRKSSSGSWAPLTFPASAAALAHLKGGIFLGSSGLETLGYFEVVLSLGILLLAAAGTMGSFLKKQRDGGMVFKEF